MHRAVRRQVLNPVAILEQAAERTGIDHRAGEQMRARLLALLDERDRNIAESLRNLGVLLEQLTEADRTGKACGPGADDEDPYLDTLVDRVARLGDELAAREGRREVRSARHADLRWFTSSVSFGTISCTSPTTPRSLNSKIGAFGSLLTATITLELCMPTLCWIAPEMPSAT